MHSTSMTIGRWAVAALVAGLGLPGGAMANDAVSGIRCQVRAIKVERKLLGCVGTCQQRAAKRPALDRSRCEDGCQERHERVLEKLSCAPEPEQRRRAPELARVDVRIRRCHAGLMKKDVALLRCVGSCRRRAENRVATDVDFDRPACEEKCHAHHDAAVARFEARTSCGSASGSRAQALTLPLPGALPPRLPSEYPWRTSSFWQVIRDAPTIRSFELSVESCSIEHNPDEGLLSYEVTAPTWGSGIVLVRINRLHTDNSIRVVHEWRSEMPVFTKRGISIRDEVPVDKPVEGYVLTAWNAKGSALSKRKTFHYKLPIEFEIESTIHRRPVAYYSDGSARAYEYSVRVLRAENVSCVSSPLFEFDGSFNGCQPVAGDCLRFEGNVERWDERWNVGQPVHFFASGTGPCESPERRDATVTSGSSYCTEGGAGWTPAPPPPPDPEPEPEHDSTWEVTCRCINPRTGEYGDVRIQTCAAPPEVSAHLYGLNLQCILAGQDWNLDCGRVRDTEEHISRNSCPWGAGWYREVPSS